MMRDILHPLVYCAVCFNEWSITRLMNLLRYTFGYLFELKGQKTENAGRMRATRLIVLTILALPLPVLAQQTNDDAARIEYFALKDTIWENISNNRRLEETIDDAKRFVAINERYHFEPHYKPVRYLALAFRNANMPDSSIWAMENQRTICELNSDSVCLSTLYFVYAGVLMDQFYPDSALKVQLKLLEIRKNLRPKTQLASLRDNIAFTLTAIEDYTSAVDMYETAYQEALDSLERKPNPEMERYFRSTIFNNRCNASMTNTILGRYERARENLLSVLDDLQNQTSYQKRMFFYAKGLLEAKLGYYEAATDNLLESVKYAREASNHRFVLIGIASLVEVSLNGKINNDKLPQWISEGIEAQKKLVNYGSNFYKLAAIYAEQQGDTETAFLYAKKSIEITESRTPKDLKARMLYADYEKSTLSEEHKRIYEGLVDSMNNGTSNLLRYLLSGLLLTAIGVFTWRRTTRQKGSKSLTS